MSASTPLLSLKGITKIFPGVRALENVQLDLWPGKVTALIGENGAGKSTLVKVMTGIYQPEEGEILYKAIPIHLPTPESAHKVGITAIHQETVLFDELSVSENIFVGQYLYKGLLKTLDWPAMHRRANEILTRLEVQIDPRATHALQALNVEKGEVAVLSATPTSTNQNIWIEEMKKVLPQYPSVQLVTVAYGDDLSDKSYREAVGLLKSYPDLKVIVSPSSVGIVAAAQAVKDQGKIGKVYVTGLGLPSEMAGAIKSGASKSFAIWNPIDLGYAATYLADDLVKGTATKTEASMGKLGKVNLDAEGNGAMAKPFVYDASNIDKFSKIF